MILIWVFSALGNCWVCHPQMVIFMNCWTRNNKVLIFVLVVTWMTPHYTNALLRFIPQKTRFMGPTWGPTESCRPQMGPMLAPCTLLSGTTYCAFYLQAEISGFCDEGNQYFTTQTGRQKTRCHAAVQTIEDSKKQNDSTFAFHFNTIPASQPLQKPKALHSNNSSNANMSQKGWGLFQTNEQSQNTFNTLFPTGANIRQSQNSVCSLIGTSSVSTNSQNDSTLLFEATSGVKHSLSPVSSDTSQSKNGTCTPIGSSAATKTSQQDASFVAGSSPDNKQPQVIVFIL